MGPGEIFLWEFMGTAVLTLLGCGVVANVTLRRTKGHGADWLLISFGWGFAVFAGASVAAPTDAHINPAVTLGLAVDGQVPWSQVPIYVAAQVVGGTVGAGLCWLVYKLQFDTHDDPAGTGDIFYTTPTVRHPAWNVVSEAIATFVLVLWIIVTPETKMEQGIPDFGNDALGYAGVAFVVISLGASLGGPTGYAINPARDLGPRIAYALLPIRGKSTADWGYSWVPIAGPLLGGILAGALASVLPAS